MCLSLTPISLLKRALSSHIRHYQRRYLSADIMAGMMLTVLLIPQSMAYALLAGLPPIMGLYASILPVMVYGLMGSTRFLTVGPTAITSVLAFSTLITLNPVQSDAYIAQAILLALLTGLVFIVVGLLRLGWLVNFLNQPVIIGYVNAAAVIILVSQLTHITGINTPDTASPFLELYYLLRNITNLNWVTFLLGMGSLLIMLQMKRLGQRKVKSGILRLTRLAPLMVVIICLAITVSLNLDTRMNVVVVGDLPRGLPQLHLPDVRVFDFSLLVGALTIAAVGFVEAMSTAKAFTTANREYIGADRELVSMGVANVVSAFSGGLPVTTSISRSSVNQTMGARSGISSVVAGLCLLLITLLFADYFYFLPRAVLAAVIMSSFVSIITFAPIQQIWHYSRYETIPFYVTFFGVLFFGIATGIIGGLVAAIGVHVIRTSRPYIAVLGRVGNTMTYDNLKYNPSARLMPNTILVQIAENIYFANAQYLEDFLRQALSTYSDKTNIVIDASAINRIDANGLQMLSQLIDEFSKSGIELYFADLHPQQSKRFYDVRFPQAVGEHRFFDSLHEAVLALEGNTDLKLADYHI